MKKSVAVGVGIVMMTASLLATSLSAAAPDPGWGTAVLLETSDQDMTFPVVASDPYGNAIAAWRHFDGTNDHLWSSRYAAGAGWSAPELIEFDDTGGADAVRVGMDAAGNAIAVWTQFNASVVRNAWANRYEAGVGWGTPELIRASGTDTTQARVAVSPRGDAMAVWQEGPDIWANRYVPGLGWTGPLVIVDFFLEAANAAEVAMDAGGNATVVFQHLPFIIGTIDVLAVRYTAGVGWGGPQPLELDNTGNAEYPVVAMDAAGNAMAAWYQSNGTRYNVFANRFSAAGAAWEGRVYLESDDTGDAFVYGLAMDPRGDAIAQWTQSDGVRYNVWANRYAAGTGWEGATLLETADTAVFGDGRVAMNLLGDAVVAWTQQDGGVNSILSNRYVAGVGWTGATLVETNTTHQARFPRVAIDRDGNAFVVWNQDDGTRGNAWANRYAVADTDGDGLGDVAEVSLYGTSPFNADTDRDDLPDGFEIRVSLTNPIDADSDNDGLGDGAEVFITRTDPLDPDTDGGGVPDGWEAGNNLDPKDAADEAADADGDGLDNLGEYLAGTDPWTADTDGDGAADGVDAFPRNAFEYADNDNDGIGDNGDPDDDNDGWSDAVESQLGSNPWDMTSTPADTDADGTPDAWDTDDDNDGAADENDAFPRDAAETLDTDGDGVGNNADTDDDNDGLDDASDPQPLVPNPQVAPSPPDYDGDGVNDTADPDDDNDGVQDIFDAFPLNQNEWADTDADGVGDNADSDDDNDGWPDAVEMAAGSDPWSALSMPGDMDGDAIADIYDPDIDGDGRANTADYDPFNPAVQDPPAVPPDYDGDGIPDASDTDDDNDGMADATDDFPMNANEWVDTDVDGVGDNADTDDDGDGWSDAVEWAAGSDASSAASTPADFDSDGVADIYDPDIDGDGTANTADYDPFDPLVTTPPVDHDGDGVPDVTDPDDDDDGIPDGSDPQPFVPNQQVVIATPAQDFDGDGLNDSVDPDLDNDYVLNAQDDFPMYANEWADTDNDGVGDNADPDDDGDGWYDIVEIMAGSSPLNPLAEPLDANSNGVPDILEPAAVQPPPADFDGDGLPDATDPDVDGDGTANTGDDCPRDPRDVKDTDSDLICDNADQDDDNDQVLDSQDAGPFDASNTKRITEDIQLPTPQVNVPPAESLSTLLVAILLLLAVIAVLLVLQFAAGRKKQSPPATPPAEPSK